MTNYGAYTPSGEVFSQRVIPFAIENMPLQTVSSRGTGI